jgi:hypothetical protein
MTPWGATKVVEELTVPQRAGEKRFATIVQLLADSKGDKLVRFAYTTGGTTRRGPVTLRARDLERLRNALAEHPGAGSGPRAPERTSVRTAERSVQQM